ncbi:hypothetical protein [Haliovirga abyssi]|uniref:Uncharacterized protein n=1 Tax=Haliovirga abyssi TaxID=2996794 RepID=A0AAU9D108_9FUSO|nr:hypothetical protein [Haliovirga abyssi]BDU49654.1 hypothetical protein HLVA_02230 [Haliovirga abyssi]
MDMFFFFILLGMSFFFLILGVYLLRKKPLIAKGGVFVSIVSLCFFPTVIKNIIESYEYGGVYFKIIGLVFILFYIWLIFILIKSYGDIVVFNSKEEELYKSVYNSLENLGIEFEENRGKIISNQNKIELKLNHSSFFKITNLYIKSDEKFKNVFSSEIKKEMKDIRLSKISPGSVTYIIGGVFLITILTLWII